MNAPADPVRGLMHQHRELCEHAVDPLEIAAGLEAHGVTDRTAARFKHRDVFSLAEELYARVPRADARSRLESGVGGAGGVGEAGEAGDLGAPSGAAAPPAASAAVPHRRGVPSGRAALPLLPGALCALVLGALALVPAVPPFARLTVALVGAVVVLMGARYALRAVPLPRGTALWICWLAGFALHGDRLLANVLAGGPDVGDLGHALLTSGVREMPGAPGTALALALGVAPAVWCARWFSARARRRLAVSVSLEEFAAGVRPLLAGVVALFAVALLAVQGAAHALAGTAYAYVGARADAARALPADTLPADAVPQPDLAGPLGVSMALGVLLFAALLLTAHGFGPAASAGLGAACAGEALALTAVLAARLPGLGVLGRPVETAVAACGPYAVTVTACACAALGLLAYAAHALTGASAHHRAAEPA
ncbi:hypothetical protein [Streptomyces sp. NPDC048172]|uniref:hypothetical protein n=1 Tax=Streptomyces sp. NPDC048172 TaxID=3365505 RepID=UPI0037200878